MQYDSDIILAERYRDEQTGIEGVATALMFYQYACERVMLEAKKQDGSLLELMFDAPRLTHIPTQQPVVSERPGGPGSPVAESRRNPASRATTAR